MVPVVAAPPGGRMARQDCHLWGGAYQLEVCTTKCEEALRKRPSEADAIQAEALQARSVKKWNGQGFFL
jgi:hypothetical protein